MWSGKRLVLLERKNILTGFTLIELLVVIAIIALLMAILMPVARRARNHARAVVCQSNLKQWGTTLALYLENNNGRIPYGSSNLVWLLRGPQLNEGDPNVPLVYHNLTTKGISLCPMATKVGTSYAEFGSNEETGDKIIGIRGSKFTAWEIRSPAPAFSGSYGFNFSLHRLSYHGSAGMNIFTFKNSSFYPILLDSTIPNGAFSATGVDPPRPPREKEGLGGLGTPACINRHNGHVNCLFLDFSVRKVGLKELWKLKWNEVFDTNNRWTIAGGVQPEDWPEWMRHFKDY